MAKTPIREILFGRLALGARFVTEEQIAECLELQKRYEGRGGPVPRLGELLAAKGYMSAEQVRAILEGQHDRREGLFGEIAARWRLISREDLEAALDVQRGMDAAGKHRERLGEILVKRGKLQAHHVRAILDAQGKRIVHCSGCNARFNIAQFRAGARLICSKCGATTVLGEADRHVADNSPLDVVNTIWLPAAGPSGSDVMPAAVEAAGGGEEGGTGAATATGGATPQIGGYEILTRLGSDAAGLICKARHQSTGNLVALKVFRGGPSQDQASAERFLEASRGSVYLDHPGLKRVYEVGCDRGRCFLAEEYIEGRSLKRHLETVGRTTVGEALDIAGQLAEALEYGHRQGVIHGDVRPSNAIIDRSGRTRLSGLGVAKDAVLNLRYLGRNAPNTPYYLSPEAALDPARVDVRSDIYSLGAVLYHMLTGRPPFTGRGSLEVLMRLTQESPAPLEQVDPQLPPDLCGLVTAMLSAEPDERPQTMSEVLGRLRQTAAARGIAPLKPPPLPETSATAGGTTSLTRAGTTSRPFAHPVGARAPRAEARGRERERAKSGSSAGLGVVLILGLLAAAGIFVFLFVQQMKGDPPAQPAPLARTPERPPPPPVPTPAAEDSAERLYQEAIRFEEANTGDDENIAARFQAVMDKYPRSGYASPSRERWAKHMSLASNRALEALGRARAATESKGDFRASLSAIDDWSRRWAAAGDEALSRGRQLRTAVLSAQDKFLVERFAEADKLAAAGKFADARGLLADPALKLTPEGERQVAPRVAEIVKREQATLDADARARAEAERRRQEEEERRAREERTARVAARAETIRAEVADLVAARKFEKARGALEAFAVDSAGTPHDELRAQLADAVALGSEFHGRFVAAVAAGGGGDTMMRYNGKLRKVLAADAASVTLAMGEGSSTVRWADVPVRELLELARVYVPRDDQRAMLGYAMLASAFGEDAEARRYLELAAGVGPVGASARAAVENRLLLSEAERRRRAAQAEKLVGRAEKLRDSIGALVAQRNFAGALEETAAARAEMVGTDHETRFLQMEEAVKLLAGFHDNFLAALRARKGAAKLAYAGRPRSVTDATGANLVLDVDGAPSKHVWTEFPPKELAALAAAVTDTKEGKDGAALAGMALFDSLIGDEPAARGNLELAAAAGARVAAARRCVDERLLLTADERRGRESVEKRLAGRFDELRARAAETAAAGDFDKVRLTLSGGRGELAGSPYETPLAQLEEACALLGAFHKGMANAMKGGRGNPQLRYLGQLRRVTDASPTAGLTVDLGEGAPMKLAWSSVGGRELCELAARYADPKDGAAQLGYALLCSARGDEAAAKAALARAEALSAKSPAVRAVIENRWLLTSAAPEKKE